MQFLCLQTFKYDTEKKVCSYILFIVKGFMEKYKQSVFSERKALLSVSSKKKKNR